MTHPQEGLDAWTEQVHAYRIPRYDELPTLELYMDQVVAVIDDCLRIYLRDSKAQRLTPDRRVHRPTRASFLLDPRAAHPRPPCCSRRKHL